MKNTTVHKLRIHALDLNKKWDLKIPEGRDPEAYARQIRGYYASQRKELGNVNVQVVEVGNKLPAQTTIYLYNPLGEIRGRASSPEEAQELLADREDWTWGEVTS